MVDEQLKFRAVMVASMGFMVGMVLSMVLENIFHVVYFIPTLILAAASGVVAFRNIGKAGGMLTANLDTFSLLFLGIFLAAMFESLRIRLYLVFDVPRYILGTIVIYLCYHGLKENWSKGG